MRWASLSPRAIKKPREGRYPSQALNHDRAAVPGRLGQISFIWALAVAPSLGCSTRDVVLIPSDLRDNTDAAMVAAAAYSEDGALIALSGIAVLDGAIHLSIEPGESAFAIDLVGWAREDIPHYGEADPAYARAAPLTVADECEASFPTPRIARRILGVGLPAAGALTLKSSVVTSCAPGWAEQISVELRCLTSYCEPVVTETGCEATVNLLNCRQGSFTVRPRIAAPCVKPIDRACFGDKEVESGARQLVCSTNDRSCDIRFYTRDDPDWATVRRRKVIDVEPQAVPGIIDHALKTWHRTTGYLGSLFTLGGRQGVVSYDGRFRQRSSFCASVDTDTVLWLDSNLEQVGTSTLPPCTRRVVARADGQRAYGFASQARDDIDRMDSFVTSLTVFELDALGRIRRQADVDLSGLDLRGVTQAILSPDDRTLILGTHHNQPTNLGLLLFVDLSTFEVERVRFDADDDIYGLALEADTLVIVGDVADNVTWMHLGTREIRDQMEIPHSASLSAGDVISDPTSNQTFVAVPSDDATIVVYNRRRFVGRTGVYQGTWLPLTFGRIGLDDGEQIVIGAARPPHGDKPWDAALARLSIADQGVRPGVLELGYGVVGHTLRSDDGTLWLTLPWAGEVLQVRPTDR